MSTATQLIKEHGAKPVDPKPAELDAFRPIETSIIIPIIIDGPKYAEMTLKCLKHIGQSVDRSKTEVILVDNGSKQPAYFSTDVYIKNPVNLGYGPAINQGIKLARGRYIVPMNNDVFVQKGWLEPLIAAVNDKEHNVGVARPIQVGQGAYGAEKRKFGDPRVAYDRKDYHGFCYLIPRMVLEEVMEGDRPDPTRTSYFDEQFRPGYCEDMDMWVRLTNAGYEMAKCSDSKVEHLGGQTATLLTQADPERFEGLLNKNRKLFKEKHGFDVFSEEWYTAWRELRQKFGEV